MRDESHIALNILFPSPPQPRGIHCGRVSSFGFEFHVFPTLLLSLDISKRTRLNKSTASPRYQALR